jgi:hypothetical protein
MSLSARSLCNSLRSLAVTALLIVPATLVAHHDLSKSYDLSKSVTLRGFVTKVDWADPHVLIRLNVRDQGRPANWTLEAGAAAELAQMGWARDALRIGAEITVTANPALDDAPRKAYITKIERGGGAQILIAEIW